MHKAQKHFPKMDLCSVLLDHSCQENHRSSGRCCFFLIQITKQKRLISGVARMLIECCWEQGKAPHLTRPPCSSPKRWHVVHGRSVRLCCDFCIETNVIGQYEKREKHKRSKKKKKNCEKHRERISLDILSTRHAEHGKGRLGDGEKVGERERETGTWEDDHQSAFFCCAQLGALLVEETESEGKRNTSIKRGRGRQEEGKEEWGKHMLALSRPAKRQW